MKALLEPIKEIARFDELFRDLKKGTAGVTVISGCLESQKAHMIAANLIPYDRRSLRGCPGAASDRGK